MRGERLAATASAISLGIAVGASMGGGVEQNVCGPQWRLSGKDNQVFICKTADGKIIAQGQHTPERELPPVVDNIYAVWSSWNGDGEKVGFYKYDDGYYFVYDMDLLTGEIKQKSVWCEKAPECF